MKLTYFYLFIIIPFLLILLVKKSSFFLIFILIYALVYRPIINYFRLKHLNIIDEKKFFYVFIPFWETQYMKEIFFKA